MVINGLGAAGTALVTALVLATTFSEGAWMVLIAVSVLVAWFSILRRHYDTVHRHLRTGSPDSAGRTADLGPHFAVLPRQATRGEVSVHSLEQGD